MSQLLETGKRSSTDYSMKMCLNKSHVTDVNKSVFL